VANDVFLGTASGEVNEADDWWIGKYLAGETPTHPFASPLFGDLHGFPPVLIMVAKNERPFDDSRRFHEKAVRSNVDSTLECWEHVCHAWTTFSVKMPESDRALRRMGEFVKSRCRNR
jgi:acetyl esterase/lipase